MANYQLLKADIDAKVYQNGQQEITGANLNSVLNAMVASLGAGYQFIGVATPTNPGTAQTPDYKCFYIATTPGTYTNIGGLVVADGEVAILKYDSSWTKEVTGIASADKLNQLDLHVDNNTGYIVKSERSFVQGSSKTHFWELSNPIPENRKWSLSLEIASGIVNQYRIYFLYKGDSDYTLINQYCTSNLEYHFQEVREIVGVQIYVSPSNAIGTGNGNMVVSVYDNGQVETLTEHISKMVGGIIGKSLYEFGNIVIEPNIPWIFEDSLSRIRTKTSTRLSKGTIISHNDFDTFKIFVGYRDVYGGYFASGWKTEAFELPCDADVVIVITTISGTVLSKVSDYTDGMSVVSPDSLSSIVDNNVKEYQDRIVGQGDLIYYGKRRLQLSPNSQQFRCRHQNIYREIFGTGNPRTKAQSMAYANDRIFVFGSDNYCDIYVLSDMENNHQRVSLPFDIAHWNNAQASQTFINSNKYPLILLSRGDYASDGRSTDCYLIQVSEPTNYSYTFAIYKTIHNTIDESKWNGSWVADWQKKKLYLYTYERGGFDVLDNNDTIIFEFDLPDITSTEDVTLGYNDVKRIIHLPHFTMQGADIIDGKLFMPGEGVKIVNDGHIWLGYNGTYGDICALQVIDLSSGSVINYVPTGNIENEGIFILDGKVYLMSHNGTPSVSSDIVFKIDEFDFLNDLKTASLSRVITGTADFGVNISIPKHSTFAVDLIDNSGVYGDNTIPFYFNYGNGAVRVGDLIPNQMLFCRTLEGISEVRIYASSSKIVQSGGTIVLQVQVLSELLDY